MIKERGQEENDDFLQHIWNIHTDVQVDASNILVLLRLFS